VTSRLHLSGFGWGGYMLRVRESLSTGLRQPAEGRLKTIQLLPVILVPFDRPGQTFLETDSG
jgi:hypothetical protein